MKLLLLKARTPAIPHIGFHPRRPTVDRQAVAGRLITLDYSSISHPTRVAVVQFCIALAHLACYNSPNDLRTSSTISRPPEECLMPHSARRIMNIVGARPNMVKMAPLIAEMARHPGLHPILVHTGQHYDYAMSQAFFEQLRLPDPDYNLGVGSAPQHVQIAEIIRRFGDLVRAIVPTWWW